MGYTFIPMLSGILELLSRVVVIVLLADVIGFRGVAISEASAWFSAGLMLMVYFFYKFNKVKKEFYEETGF